MSDARYDRLGTPPGAGNGKATDEDLRDEFLRGQLGERRVEAQDDGAGKTDRGEKPQGFPLPLDDVSPLYGKSWREIGLDAFSNHRTQGITGFLNSPFLRRPITLKREDGGDFDPSSLNEPLGPLDEDFEVGNKGVDPLMRVVDASLIAARDAALRLDYKASADALVAAGKKLDQIPVPSLSSQLPPPMASLATSVRRKREKITAALTMVTGLRLVAMMNSCRLRRMPYLVKTMTSGLRFTTLFST